MARSTYCVTQARRELPRLLREAEGGMLVGIARRDETLELLENPRARRAIDEHRAGRTRFVPLSALDDE